MAAPQVRVGVIDREIDSAVREVMEARDNGTLLQADQEGRIKALHFTRPPKTKAPSGRSSESPRERAVQGPPEQVGASVAGAILPNINLDTINA